MNYPLVSPGFDDPHNRVSPPGDPRLRHTGRVHARSAVVDLYGDHLSSYGYWAPIAALVRLAQPCGVQPQATRTAVSRLVARGWLQAARRGDLRGYAATDGAVQRLQHAARRIYAPGPEAWDGSWHVVIVDPPGQRRVRDQVAATMGYLGYGRLSGSTWVSPRRNPELSSSLTGHGVTWTGISGPLDTHILTADLVVRVWDLPALAQGYAAFLATLPSPTEVGSLSEEDAFAVRARVVHDWRTFLFLDPGLPRAVLPSDWPGEHARQRFLQLAADLRSPAEAFVGGVLRAPGGRAS